MQSLRSRRVGSRAAQPPRPRSEPGAGPDRRQEAADTCKAFSASRGALARPCRVPCEGLAWPEAGGRLRGRLRTRSPRPPFRGRCPQPPTPGPGAGARQQPRHVGTRTSPASASGLPASRPHVHQGRRRLAPSCLHIWKRPSGSSGAWTAPLFPHTRPGARPPAPGRQGEVGGGGAWGRCGRSPPAKTPPRPAPGGPPPGARPPCAACASGAHGPDASTARAGPERPAGARPRRPGLPRGASARRARAGGARGPRAAGARRAAAARWR